MGDYRNRLLTFIKRAEMASQAAKERAVRVEGLTKAQFNALLVLRHEPGITSAELARRCSVTAQTMSSVLPRLVERGLVARAAHPRHQNVLEITITPAGQALVERADRRVEDVEDAIAGALEPHERDQLRDLLSRCTAAAEEAASDTAEAQQASG